MSDLNPQVVEPAITDRLWTVEDIIALVEAAEPKPWQAWTVRKAGGRMTEQEMKLEARLLAIEYMLANAFRLMHRAFGSTPQMVYDAHKKAREMLAMQTIPGIDLAESDLWTAEIQHNVERLLLDVEEMLGLARSQG
jgi:hypothetical protein